MSTPDGQWHGWAHGENALYLAPIDEERIGLYLQVGRETELAGVLMDPAMAQLVMDFMDASLGATAAANAELLRRLEHEQPLTFSTPTAPSARQDFIEPDADELLVDEG